MSEVKTQLNNIKNGLVDGETIVNKSLFNKIIDSIIDLDKNVDDSINNQITSDGVNKLDFCHNLGTIGEFLQKYVSKDVDEFNQLTICMAGDSIFGRQQVGRGGETSPEMSFTIDTNNPSSGLFGYQTGHFPPNMWQQTVAYKTLELFQYDNADVKYYHHSAPELTFSGVWTDIYPVEADHLRVIRSTQKGAYVEFGFTQNKFLKIVFTDYAAGTTRRSKVRIKFSTDDGVTWLTPSDLGLVCSEALDSDGIYSAPTSANNTYKWLNLRFKGFDENISYKVRVENYSNVQVSFWGFETWSNPRINVVVVAEGGNTARSQLNSPCRFYSEMYNQSLVIYELPYLNDLGTGPLARFKGMIKTTNEIPSSPTEQDFYYCNEDGLYFNTVYAKRGEYIEYSNGNWQLGSSKLDSVLNSYINDNRKIFKRLSTQGVPVVIIYTHASIIDSSRPFCPEIGMPFLKGLGGEYGFASLDINGYQRARGFYTTSKSIHSDGTHLNDKGVNLYLDLISVLKTCGNTTKYSGSPKVTKQPLYGKSTGGNTVEFNYEFSSIPNITILDNNDVHVTNVTKSNFATSGTGEFTYMAQIIEL